MKAVIISIGDELVLGQTVDANSAWLSAKLAESGVMTLYHKTVADDQQACKEAFLEAADKAGLVLVTGGLGPTDDDLTRQALAAAMGCALVVDEASLSNVRSFFKKLGRNMPEKNAIQAMRPAGAEMIDNTCGTAPGLRARLGSALFYVMPGVPHEMRAMFDNAIAPRLAEVSGRVILTSRMDTFGQGESLVAELLDGLMDRDRNPLVGTTAADGIVSVRVRSEGASHAEAASLLENVSGEIRNRLGDIIFSEEGVSFQESVGNLIARAGVSVATAESCTGGLIGKMLTDMPGASAFYKGGWIVYSNELKEKLLDIEASLIREHGAVSERVAIRLAENALEKSGATFAVSTTGIAGPTGGTDAKPVGTVWIGLADRMNGASAVRHVFPGNRESVRARAARTALDILRLSVTRMLRQ